MENAAGSSGFFLRSKSIAVLLNFVILSPSVPRALVKHLDPDADARGRADTVQAEVKPENPKRQTDPEGKEREKKSNRTGKKSTKHRGNNSPHRKVLTSPFFYTVYTIYTILMSVKEPPPIACSLIYHKK